VRWALEEARLPYRVKSVPFGARNAEHFAHEPFGQVPWLTDGDISIFESGAILLHLTLQLPFPQVSESMGNHDSKIVDAGSVN
jgi:glutathione S-transferase